MHVGEATILRRRPAGSPGFLSIAHHSIRILRVRLDMLLQVLGTLECLPTDFAFMRLQWDMHADVRRDVIALYRRSRAIAPVAFELEVVGALAPNMLLADVILCAISSAQKFSLGLYALLEVRVLAWICCGEGSWDSRKEALHSCIFQRNRSSCKDRSRPRYWQLLQNH
jgi:hypothetical protein